MHQELSFAILALLSASVSAPSSGKVLAPSANQHASGVEATPAAPSDHGSNFSHARLIPRKIFVNSANFRKSVTECLTESPQLRIYLANSAGKR